MPVGRCLHLNICIKQRGYHSHFLPVSCRRETRIIGLIQEPNFKEPILRHPGLPVPPAREPMYL